MYSAYRHSDYKNIYETLIYIKCSVHNTKINIVLQNILDFSKNKHCNTCITLLEFLRATVVIVQYA